MERSDLISRKSGGNRGVDAVTDARENYFYDVRVSGTAETMISSAALLTYGPDDRCVEIGGGLRAPIAETMTLYDVPRGDTGLYSLGQLQHFQISDYFDEAGYAIGGRCNLPIGSDELFPRSRRGHLDGPE